MRASRIIGSILAAGFALDLLSIIGWSVPAWVTPITVALLAVVAILAFSDIRLGVAVVLLELLWGSHGYLLKIPTGGLNVSLRMGIFLVVLGATVWHLRQRRARTILWQALRNHPARWPALAFLATLAYGLATGLLRHSFDRVFFDANAWGFLALAPAFLLTALSRGQPFYRHGAAQGMQNAKCKMQNDEPESFFIHHSSFIILAGALYLIARTYLLLFVFSHDLGGFWLAAYQWVRDTRLGEVTIFPGAFPRVFLPSMALLFPALLLAAQRMTADVYGWPRITDEGKDKNFSPSYGEGERVGVGDRVLSFTVFSGSIALLLLSLSRSYWLAGLALFVIGIVSASTYLRREGLSLFRSKLRKVVRQILLFGGVAVGACGVAIVLVRLPYPKPLTTAGVGETLLARLSADAAVSNRWQQIGPLRDAILQHPVLGNGFGAAVTYETRDPRTLAAYPDGKYTTTAFEWGYLDDLLERGVVGLLAELWLLTALVWHGVRQKVSPPLSEGEREGVRVQTRGGSAWGWGSEQSALAIGLLAIAIVHATSPYLNHPLGIGLLLLLFAMEAPRTPEEKRGVMSVR